MLSWLIFYLLLLTVFWGVGYLFETWQNKHRADRVLYHASNLGEIGPLLCQIIDRYIGSNTNQYSLVEPGAGLATVSRYLGGKYPWREIQAVEIGGFILIIGRLRQLFSLVPIRLIHKDIFVHTFPARSVVYCYLFSSLLTKLWQNGQLTGHLVISLTFPIQGVEPTEVIPLKSWQGQLYVYDFRTELVR